MRTVLPCTRDHRPRADGLTRVAHRGLLKRLGLVAGMLAVSVYGIDPPVAAQSLGDLSLEELLEVKVESVYGASKYEQKVTHAPASVTIMTEDEIKRDGASSLADIFRSAPGLYVTDDRSYSYLGFRGFSQPGDFNTGVLLLIDGHRVNDALHNRMFIAREAMFDVDLIERVEIIRGPSSSIYGNSAFFGVVNIIPKRGGEINGAEVSTEAGSMNTYKTRVTFGKKFVQGPEVLLSVSHFESAGDPALYYPEYDTAATNHGIAVNSDRERADRFYGSVSYRDLTLSAAYSKRTKRIPTAPSGTAFNTGLGETNDEHDYVDLKFEHELADDLKILARVSYDRYPSDAIYPYADATRSPSLILNQNHSLGEWVRAEVQVTKRLFSRHTLIFGAEYEDDLRLDQENFDAKPYVEYLSSDHTARNFGLYSQGEFELGHEFRLNAGLRYDHFESFGGTLNPRLGLIYNPREKSTFKLLYGEAFRAPNDYERNFQSPTFQRNPSLHPITIRTYEVVYEQYLRGQLRFSASAYHYSINGLISESDASVSGNSAFQNLGRVDANGLELQLEGHFRGGVLTRMSYALQRAEVVDSGQELSNSPRQLAKLNVTVPFDHDRLSSSLEFQYRGSALTPDRHPAKSFVVVNWTLFARKLAPGLELSASVYNLLDQHYSTPSSDNTVQDTIPQNGRSFRAKLTYAF